MIALLASLSLLAAPVPRAAELELPALFGDHMVAQCERPFHLWGRAAPGAEVRVHVARPEGEVVVGQMVGAQAGSDGTWQVRLGTFEAGGPWRITIDAEGAEPRVLQDVWFGEVWICSGQSNMEWPLARSSEAEAEIASADRPALRLLRVPRRASGEPRAEPQGAWTTCTPETAREFSAVGYHFGRALQAAIDRPVGLIQAAWGGTPAEAWTERSFLEGVEAFGPIFEREPRNEAWAPSALYNGMIASLVRLQVAGAIWYQGESNAGRAEQYRQLFPALIESWREAFGRDELPFLFVQLANFKQRAAEPGESDWAELREAQALALGLPRTGMAVTIDVGEADDIHPRDKRTVGERLALEARRIVYAQDVVSRGPTLRAMRVEGGRVVVELDHAEGLRTSDGGPPTGFALAGSDRVFHWAEAALEGERVVLSCLQVPAPVAVRFAWADNPAHNLFNGAGQPAVPFRSDEWPGVTAGRR